ncbi:cytochrome P450 [Streptomyces sp. NBC_01237]|uniref:cytochrome P450 n=1 Tax=Streptomyces sp. NBC_01237 TaxID=2903790 RepID=UPI002DDA0BEA|nr:cytochrome P450 [Streptomyces sp. NBC_01237]WRZ77192.1 cytochrome P450 [Streptomyces sp. NBC_01237]
MQQPQPTASAGQCPVRPPVPPPAGPLQIYGPAFDQDPHATYQQLRQQGPIAPVEISPGVYGYLVVSYWSALYVLRNTPHLFAKDSRLHWTALRDGQVPADSPARMMMQPRDNALWKDGEEHQQLRGAITGALARVDTYDLAAAITRIADQLIDAFAGDGHADLVTRFADPLAMMTVTELFDAPPEIGSRIVKHVTTLFAAGPDAAQANTLLEAACLELVHAKRTRPGRDVVTYLIQAGLTDPELVQTLLLLFGAAAPPAAKAIGRTTQRYLTDAHLAQHVHTGVRPVAAALEAVLWDDPPVSNYSPLFARSPMPIHGAFVQPSYPILISFAAANSDPGLGLAPAARAGNRGHIAFSAGVHGCPAQGMGRLIVETAVERLLDRLSGLALAIPDSDVPNLPGTFLAGPASLPVSFRPAAPALGR